MLISLGVDYHAADVAMRERFHVTPQRIAKLYEALGDDGISEMALLGTCNRTELYAWCPDAESSLRNSWQRSLAKRWTRKNGEADALLEIAVARTGEDAARHAIRVAVGLESQILGDSQILGQFRSAYADAAAARATGPVLHRLFETALRAGKQVQTNTLLGSGKNSIGAQAASLASRRFGTLTHTRIVVCGCGKTGERVARQLAKFGARDVVFINRSPERSAQLAKELWGRSAPLETLHAEIAMADIAIVATGSDQPIVLADKLQEARANCATSCYPLLLIDLSMPRNIEFGAAALAGITLVDLDALRPQVNATEQTRRAAVPAAERMVDVEVKDFMEWCEAALAREAIRPLREALADVCRRELAFAAGEEEAERIAKRIVAKLMARPMSAARGVLARGEPLSDMTRTMSTLFAAPEIGSHRINARTVSATD